MTRRESLINISITLDLIDEETFQRTLQLQQKAVRESLEINAIPLSLMIKAGKIKHALQMIRLALGEED